MLAKRGKFLKFLHITLETVKKFTGPAAGGGLVMESRRVDFSSPATVPSLESVYQIKIYYRIVLKLLMICMKIESTHS